ncbi:MAG TPA: macro domain-containing protein [Clostridiaceae bacterium]|nr:macro domain-containing protein [Clostridiaceae bacterium]
MEHKLYLINIGGRLAAIREKLGWTQEELANRIGLSRANIVSLEQNPDRMGKNAALALYTAVFGEMSIKRSQYEALDYDLWDTGVTEDRQALLRQVNSIAWGRKNTASVLAIGSTRDALAIKTALLLRFLNHPDSLPETVNLDREDIRMVLLRSLEYIESDICSYLGLERPDVGMYISSLEGKIYRVSHLEIELTIGDISQQDDIDIIVNATDTQLSGNGGGDRLIHLAAGPGLEEELKSHIPVEVGSAVVTKAYRLPNQHIIHCVGPRYGQDEPAPELLMACYRNALRLAEEKAGRHVDVSVAFPAISSGSFGYPLSLAARAALEAVLDYIPNLRGIGKIRFVLFDSHSLAVYAKLLDTMTRNLE